MVALVQGCTHAQGITVVDLGSVVPAVLPVDAADIVEGPCKVGVIVWVLLVFEGEDREQVFFGLVDLGVSDVGLAEFSS